MLMQDPPNEARKLLQYWCRTRDAEKQNYHMMHLESFAEILAFIHSRPYLETQRFTVHTDNDALK